MVIAINLLDKRQTEIERLGSKGVILACKKGQRKIPNDNAALIDELCIVYFFVDEHYFLHNP
jgi:hypothetical protein